MIILPETKSSHWDINPEMMFRLFEFLHDIGIPRICFESESRKEWGCLVSFYHHAGVLRETTNNEKLDRNSYPLATWNLLDVTRCATNDPSLLTLVVPKSSTNEKHPLLETS